MRPSAWVVAAAVVTAAACRSEPMRVDADGDGVDAASDCDDTNPLVYLALTGYADADGDGVGAGPPASFCATALPAGWVATDGDCAPDDPSAWRAVLGALADRDGDGYTVVEDVTLCVGAALPAPYVATTRGLDCDDADPALYRWVTLYRDQDGDGVGAGPRAAAWTCLGASLPAGFATAGYDVDDADPAVTVAPDEELVLGIALD